MNKILLPHAVLLEENTNRFESLNNCNPDWMLFLACLMAENNFHTLEVN